MFCFLVQRADLLSFFAGMEAPVRSYSANLPAILELILINSEVSCIKAQAEWSLHSFAEIRKQRKLKMKLEVQEEFFPLDIKKIFCKDSVTIIAE